MTTLVGLTTHGLPDFTGVGGNSTINLNGSRFYTAVATGAASQGFAYLGSIGANTTELRLIVFDSSDNWLATSNANSSLTPNAWNTFTFASPPTITSGQNYSLFVYQNAFANPSVFDIGQDTLATSSKYMNAGLTYPGYTGPFTASGTFSSDGCSIYLASSGTPPVQGAFNHAQRNRRASGRFM
jgi:hypothetical protein